MALQKLPVDIQTFSKIIDENYLYVDKTALIYRLLRSAGTFSYLVRGVRASR